MKTYFAPAERISKEDAFYQYLSITKNNSLINIIQALPEVVVLLNKFRQIVFANKTFLNLLNKKIEDVVGLRPGEAVGCIHANENKAGCGTSRFCRFCGAVKTILDGISGKNGVEECKILTQNNQVFLFQVKTVPVELDGIKYTLFTINDIRDLKALKEYQKILFIDINELLSEIVVGLDVLSKNCDENPYLKNIYDSAKTAISIIEKQKLLILAENNQITPYLVKIKSKDFLDFISNHLNIDFLKIDDSTENIEFRSDFELLTTIFENIIFALIELGEKEKIILSCKDKNDKIEFNIKSQLFIPVEIQYNIFKKGLPSKEAPAELITYLAKILTEWYLNGRLFYETNDENGTIFTLQLSKSPIV